MKRNILAVLIAFFSLANSALAAIDPATVQKLVAGDGTTNGYFGATVSVDGDTALIGATPDNKRLAYVFVRSADGKWTEQAKLIPSDGGSSSYTNTSVALDGDTALVGDDWEGYAGSGAVYVFVRSGTTWTQQAKLIAADRQDGVAYHFGRAVAMDGNTALIAAQGTNAFESPHTIAYVFVRSGTTWTQQAKIVINTTNGPWYQSSVSISGDTALIGDHGDDNGKGAAYVFVRSENDWTQQAKLTVPEGLPDTATTFGDWFGYAVSLDGDAALIGAPRNNKDALHSKGAAYIFVRSGTSWTQQAKMAKTDEGYDEFGVSVSLSGDTALIGTFGYTCSGYVFVRSGTSWTKQLRIPGIAATAFGYSVSINNGTALIGAWGDDSSNDSSNTGAAYVYGSSSGTANKAAVPAVIQLLLGK